MREIKFRAINHETGKFVYGFYTKLIEGTRIFDAIITDEFERFYIHNRETIGQLTSLKDKNGVDIYEGDILMAAPSKPDDFRPWIEVVSWEEIHCGWRCKGEPIGTYEDFELEVIGNIHQNPELLCTDT